MSEAEEERIYSRRTQGIISAIGQSRSAFHAAGPTPNNAGPARRPCPTVDNYNHLPLSGGPAVGTHLDTRNNQRWVQGQLEAYPLPKHEVTPAVRLYNFLRVPPVTFVDQPDTMNAKTGVRADRAT